MLYFERNKDDNHRWMAYLLPICSPRVDVAELWKPYRDGTVFIDVIITGWMPLSGLENLYEGARRIKEGQEDNFELGIPCPQHELPQCVVDEIAGIIKQKLGA